MMDKQSFTLTNEEWMAWTDVPGGEWIALDNETYRINTTAGTDVAHKFWQQIGERYGFDWKTVEFRRDQVPRTLHAAPLLSEAAMKLNDAIEAHDTAQVP